MPEMIQNFLARRWVSLQHLRMSKLAVYGMVLCKKGTSMCLFAMSYNYRLGSLVASLCVTPNVGLAKVYERVNSVFVKERMGLGSLFYNTNGNVSSNAF